MDLDAITDRLHQYVVDSFLAEPRAAGLRNCDDLLTILDSLQLLRLVVQLEPWFGVTVDDSELTPENLGSIERMAAFVLRKRNAGAAEPVKVLP
jgi:acyl carrier protein